MQRAQSQLGRLSPDLFPPPTKSPAQMLDFLNARTDMRRKAGKIYGAIVTQARRPAFYADLGVPDTPSGRYEMVVVHLVLVLERLRSAPAADADLPRLLVEAFIADMDDSLREMGTGDLTVPKKVRARCYRAIRAQRGLQGGAGGERRGGLGGRAQGAHLRRRRRAIRASARRLRAGCGGGTCGNGRRGRSQPAASSFR